MTEQPRCECPPSQRYQWPVGYTSCPGCGLPFPEIEHTPSQKEQDDDA